MSVQRVVSMVAGAEADRLSGMMVVLAALAVGFAILHLHPKLGVTLWLGVVCFVPVWLGGSFHYYFSPQVALGLLLVVALVPVDLTLGAADLLLVVVFVLALAPLLIGRASGPATFALMTETMVGFGLGRLIPPSVGVDFVYKCVAVLFSGVAVLAIMEFLLGWNPFVHLAAANGQYAVWGSLQERGGVLRAEGAFGHSIALGCSLALAIPLTFAARWPLVVRAVMVTVMVGASITTFSRAGMACVAMGVVLTVLFATGLSKGFRVLVVAVTSAMVLFLVPLIAQVFEKAGSEAANSAGYRGRLLSLVPDMAPLGLSSVAYRQANGDLRFGHFLSIDNALIFFGLQYGWMALAAVLMLVVAGVASIIARKASPATVAAVAQLPALVSVALITQYSILVWFVIGLAVATQRTPEAPGHTPGRRRTAPTSLVGTSSLERTT